jgi:hypothetical protein
MIDKSQAVMADSPIRHSRESGNPDRRLVWIPAFAGMTGLIVAGMDEI